MKTRRIARSIVGMVVLLLLCATVRQAKAVTVTIDFDGVILDDTSTDFDTYSEDGLRSLRVKGSVRISNLFSTVSNGAHPSFGFGAGSDFKLLLRMTATCLSMPYPSTCWKKCFPMYPMGGDSRRNEG